MELMAVSTRSISSYIRKLAMAEVRECSYPIAGKTPVITDVDNAFKSIKCGKDFGHDYLLSLFKDVYS